MLALTPIRVAEATLHRHFEGVIVCHNNSVWVIILQIAVVARD